MYGHAGDVGVYHESLADELCADFGLDAERVHVVPLPVDATALRDTSVAKPDRPLFLLFGTLRHNKGIDVLLEALTLLGSDLQADVLIAAHGARANELRLSECAATLPNVEVGLGFTTQSAKRLFLAASCVVLPYTSFHSQSAVLADAYAYRVPVVVSDVGAIGPTVRGDRTGIVVHPRDPTDLAAGLAAMAMVRPGVYAGALGRRRNGTTRASRSAAPRGVSIGCRVQGREPSMTRVPPTQPPFVLCIVDSLGGVRNGTLIRHHHLVKGVARWAVATSSCCATWTNCSVTPLRTSSAPP